MSGTPDHNILRALFSPVVGVVRWANDTLVAPGRVTSLPTCMADRRASHAWVRGGAGVADVESVCQKDAAGAYAWEPVSTGGAASTIDVQEAGSSVVAAAHAINFASQYFDISDQTGGVAGVALNKRPIDLTIYNASTTTADNEWTNMPAAATELFGFGAGNERYRTKFDLTDYTEFRVVARVYAAGATNAILGAAYATTEGTWLNLGATLATGGVSIASAGTKVGTWSAIAAGAKGDVFLTILGDDGDGTADPRFGNVSVQVR